MKPLVVVCFLSLLILKTAEGVLPAAAIDVRPGKSEPYTLLASQAFFGAYPAMEAKNNLVRSLQHAPSLLCNETQGLNVGGAILMVPRGECTFELKAKNAQAMGASGVIIYGSLASRYSLNTTKYKNQTDHTYTKDDIVYPLKSYDYDCKKGRAEIDASAISFDPLPYNDKQNDPLLSGLSDTNLCMANSEDKLASCASKSCLLTGDTTKSGKLEACCAWDLHIFLYADAAYNSTEVTIPAVYITTEQGQQLLQDMSSAQVEVILYTRYRPMYNLSAFMIWGLGVVVATVAAYLSAADYRNVASQIAKGQAVPQQDEDEARSRSKENGGALSAASRERPTYQHAESSETLELSASHAFGFIIMASSGLLILFFFKIYNIVKIMYAFGCSGAVTQVLTYPVVEMAGRRLQLRDRKAFETNFADIGTVTRFELVSVILGYGLGLVWLVVAFVVRHPEELTFFWVTQDLFGACMCIMFLSLIKLNSMRVASILLLVAFFYDIFFVFVTPLIFNGESVMVNVATSGGPPKADALWCEKYPDDANCQGGDPLPMLLTIPRIGDFAGGSSLLGLGDIVLPGLLLSFAARLDAAKHLVGLGGGGHGMIHSNTCPERKCCGSLSHLCNGGYFAPVVVAYAIGLFMANAAVYIMEMGQPALLYLVPCCLGTMVFLGWRRNELNSLWHGPKVVKAADTLAYGEMNEDGEERPVAVDDPPTADDDDLNSRAEDVDGEVPLLSMT